MAIDALLEGDIAQAPDDGEAAAFLGEGTHEEWVRQEREDQGLSNVFDIDHD